MQFSVLCPDGFHDGWWRTEEGAATSTSDGIVLMPPADTLAVACAQNKSSAQFVAGQGTRAGVRMSSRSRTCGRYLPTWAALNGNFFDPVAGQDCSETLFPIARRIKQIVAVGI